jgi:hypothetical protein
MHTSVISGFRHDIYEICVLLGYYAASNDNSLLTFWGQRVVPIFKGPYMFLHCRFTYEEGRRNVTYLATQDVKLRFGFGPHFHLISTFLATDAKDCLLAPLFLAAVVRQMSKPALFPASGDDPCK